MHCGQRRGMAPRWSIHRLCKLDKLISRRLSVVRSGNRCAVLVTCWLQGLRKGIRGRRLTCQDVMIDLRIDILAACLPAVRNLYINIDSTVNTTFSTTTIIAIVPILRPRFATPKFVHPTPTTATIRSTILSDHFPPLPPRIPIHLPLPLRQPIVIELLIPRFRLGRFQNLFVGKER